MAWRLSNIKLVFICNGHTTVRGKRGGACGIFFLNPWRTTIILFAENWQNERKRVTNPTCEKDLVYEGRFKWELVMLAQAACVRHACAMRAPCVRHACLRAPCVAWPLLLPLFSLSFSLSSFFSPSFAFDPLRGNSRVRNNFCPNILA